MIREGRDRDDQHASIEKRVDGKPAIGDEPFIGVPIYVGRPETVVATAARGPGWWVTPLVPVQLPCARWGHEEAVQVDEVRIANALGGRAQDVRVAARCLGKQMGRASCRGRGRVS